MTTGINAQSADLDTFLALYVDGTYAPNTGINFNGVDIATRYQWLGSGNGTQRADLGIQSNSVDIAAIFSQYGSTTAPSPTPAPTGGGCIAVDMYLHPSLQAKAIKEGHWIDIATFNPFTYYPGQVTEVIFLEAECLRLETAGGAVLVASETTPMPVLGVPAKLLPELDPAIDQVAANIHGRLQWDKIKSLERVGRRPIVLLRTPVQCFYAGEDPNKRIASHAPHTYYALPNSGETLHPLTIPISTK